MRRAVIPISVAALVFGGALTGTASANTPSSPNASCVATITSYEASQLPAGSVGQEVSGLVTSVPRLGQALVSPLAQKHLGSIAACG